MDQGKNRGCLGLGYEVGKTLQEASWDWSWSQAIDAGVASPFVPPSKGYSSFIHSGLGYRRRARSRAPGGAHRSNSAPLEGGLALFGEGLGCLLVVFRLTSEDHPGSFHVECMRQ